MPNIEQIAHRAARQHEESIEQARERAREEERRLDDEADKAERVGAVLTALGVSHTEENAAQMRVYLDAFDVFLERNQRHRAGWRVAGVQGIMVDLRKKVERLWTEFVMAPFRPDDEDSAIDAINYAAFLVQAVREEKTDSKVGHWEWPQAGAAATPLPAKEARS